MSEQMDDLQSEHTLEPTDSEGHLFMIGMMQLV